VEVGEHEDRSDVAPICLFLHRQDELFINVCLFNESALRFTLSLTMLKNHDSSSEPSTVGWHYANPNS